VNANTQSHSTFAASRLPAGSIDTHAAVFMPSQRVGPASQSIEALSVPDALLRVRTVSTVTGISPATIYRKVATGDFPQPVRLGARCTRWKSSSVLGWLAAQTATACVK
jgi:prophage regulatory protein